MDHKPLLQERPPAYNLEAGQGDYACGPHGYGAIPAAPPPPPYPYLVTGIPTHHPRVYNIHSRTVTRYPANSIVVVGGCPVCSLLCSRSSKVVEGFVFPEGAFGSKCTSRRDLSGRSDGCKSCFSQSWLETPFHELDQDGSPVVL
ncbi:membrane protein BRI3 isoform X1 [Macaca mulatta]|uniref:brain protein I3 isoform X1 n=1 Tax=Macaca mulatta TaxID=9544 RepID=UPI0003AB6C23|nr:brain protein I3 isoform X1 [Macaca nemestrina]XP_014989799.1 brain protein I3 isoform X1 [Macaca mulatta]XP_045245408.1 brain protein I3 isoform X1 [Macaca fascicularis]